MNSRFYDILSLIGAVLIVVFIAFVMKPGLFPAVEEEKTPSLTIKPEISDTGNISAGMPEYTDLSYSVFTKDDQKWMLGSRISKAMDYYQPATRDFAVRYIPEEDSGEFTIAQACDIWDGIRDEWTYEEDSFGIWDISPASTLVNTELKGDQNDFAAFTASLIKSVGGQARIKVAHSPQSGDYTYAELYLGNSEDFSTKMINSGALSSLKAKYPYAFSNDPSGLNVFKYESGSVCSGDSCWNYVKPFSLILNEPEKYSGLCYQYPKLIEYLLLFPDTNVVEFQAMYLKFRYSDYTRYSDEVYTLRDITYTSEFEDNGDKTYWISLDKNGKYPGDQIFTDMGYATVFYSDSSWDDIRYNTLRG